MDYKSLLNNYHKLAINVKKYFDFIGYRVPIIRGVDSYNFRPEHYEFLKIVLLEDGIYINTDLLVDHLSDELSFLGDKNQKELLLYLRSIRLTNPKEVFNKFPELLAYYNKWHDEKIDEVNQIMQQTTSKYKRYGEEIRMLEHMIKTGKIKNSSNIREKINKYKSFRSVNLNSIIESETMNAFINYLSNQISFLATYKNRRYLKLANERNVIVNNDIFYYYLAKLLFEKTDKPDLEERRLESIKKYIAKYLSDNEQYIDSNNMITITCKERYMDEPIKEYDLSDLKKLVSSKTLKKS